MAGLLLTVWLNLHSLFMVLVAIAQYLNVYSKQPFSLVDFLSVSFILRKSIFTDDFLTVRGYNLCSIATYTHRVYVYTQMYVYMYSAY